MWHALEAIVTIALCAVICGADGWVEIAEFGKATEAWVATILDVPHGAPSHDTFGQVCAALDPDQFKAKRLKAGWDHRYALQVLAS